MRQQPESRIPCSGNRAVTGSVLLGMLIDPKAVRESINNKLAQFAGRQVNGELFCAITDSIVEALNEALAPFMQPIVTVNNLKAMGDIDPNRLTSALDDLKRSVSGVGMYKPMLMLHDEIIAKTNDRAMQIGTAKHLQVEADLRREWPTPKGPLTSSRAYRCRGHSCPPRAAMSASTAPVCYTCGKTMETA